MKLMLLGVYYGTDSVRTIIADAHNGKEVAASTFEFPRWKQQLFCNAETNEFCSILWKGAIKLVNISVQL